MTEGAQPMLPPSVIPDIFSRESIFQLFFFRITDRKGNRRKKQKDGFPTTNVGNDGLGNWVPDS